ncbi:MAG: glutathione S-transferase family protein, partial [bacterium]|nr:glutathione S-transferase family protein [bacterium]
MGLLIDGEWHDTWYDTTSTKGAFKRESAQFRNAISSSAEALFPAEKNRYHLYVSFACPWAHRTLIFRKLKKLDEYIGVSVVHPHMLENGWEFRTDISAATGDSLYGLSYLYELYKKADNHYTGRVTVPVLWDSKTQTIICNESAEIIRQFNNAFNHLTTDCVDYYPVKLMDQIDTINEEIYNTVNNGVYKCGFATSQAVYEKAYEELFQTLDKLENHLKNNEYLIDNRLT